MLYKILLVDDEPLVLKGYHRILNPYFDVYTVTKPLEALEIIEAQGPFAVIVVDYHMPGLNGIDLMNQIKILSPDTTRMILTGKSDINIAIRAVNEGNIYKFLAKPCKKDDFLESILLGVEKYRNEINRILKYPIEPPLLSKSDSNLHQGLKFMYQGLKFLQNHQYSMARESLLNSQLCYQKLQDYTYLVLSQIYLVYTSLQYNKSKDCFIEFDELKQQVVDLISLIKHYELEILFEEEKYYVQPILQFGMNNKIEESYIRSLTEQMNDERQQPNTIVYTLGSFKLIQDHVEIYVSQWRNQQVLTFFLYLLSHRGRKIQKDVLLETFWPRKDPAVSSNNFSSLLYSVRTVLGKDLIHYKKGFCWLSEDKIWCDAWELEDKASLGLFHYKEKSYRDAQTLFEECTFLYKNDYLCEYMDHDWLIEKRNKIQSLYINLSIKLSKLQSSGGDIDTAIATLEELPLNTFYTKKILSLIINFLEESGENKAAERYFFHYRDLYMQKFGFNLSKGEFFR